MKRKDRSSSSNAAEERRNKKSKKTDTETAQESAKLDFSSAEKLFSSLLSPTTSEEFFSQYWEKKPLCIQRDDPGYYGSLFSKSDLDSLLKKEDIMFVQDLNLCRYEDGTKKYLNGDMNRKVTAAQMNKEVKEHKATIQFHQPQRFKDILWKLNAHLESVFGCLVGANVYITPADSQGLAPHYDDIEAIVLQLEGKKQWKLYKPTIELPQEYSPDLKQDEIGELLHEIELKEGDLLYFPRGTIHQAVTPKGSSHSTHITFSTYQQSSWGNLMSSVLTDAVEKAMDKDVEFRRGLPINFMSYMGMGMETEGKAKSKQEDFNNQVKQLLTRLVDHLDIHATVDKVATDFVFNRLPPYEQKEEAKKDQGESEKPPTEDSKVKFRYPEYVRICVGDANTIPIGVFEAGQDSDDEEDEMPGKEEKSEDESMEESEEETKPQKGKHKKQKQKGKKVKSKQKEESEEEEEEESDQDAKPNSKKGKIKKEEGKKTKKSTEKKTKKGKKKEESEEDEGEESEEEKPKSKKGKSKKDKQKKKTEKGKKGKEKSESEEEEEEGKEEEEEEEQQQKEDEEDMSFDIGDEDTGEDSDDEEESDEEDDEGPSVYVHHSLNNIRSSHMMGPQEPSVVKFAISYKEALLHLFHNRHDFIPLKSLPLEVPESLYLITSLWSEGLIRLKD